MINLFHPEATGEELQFASEMVAESGVLTKGQQAENFERSLAEVTGADFVVSASSGTSALHLAVMGMEWGNGDKIITSPYSFIATSNALLFEGCEPVYGKATKGLQLDLDHVAELLEEDPDIKGIVIPYIFGHHAETEKLKALRERFPHVGVIEDAAQALATKTMGLGIGEHSDAVTYSFHENKPVTTFGEGGAVTTRNPALAQKMWSLREHGKVQSTDWLEEIKLGYNYRLTEVQAAVGSLQLKRISPILERREEIALQYMDQIDGLGLELPTNVTRSWFGFYIVADTIDGADALVQDLSAQGIQARREPMPALTEFRHNRDFTSYDTTIAERAGRVVMLPLHTRLQDSDVEHVSEQVQKSLERNRHSSSSFFYDKLAPHYEADLEQRNVYLQAVQSNIVQYLQEKGISGTILDVGCGNGLRGKAISEEAGVTVQGIDSSSEMVKAATQNGLEAVVADIGIGITLSEKPNGALMLWNVLGHVESDKRVTALQNIYDVLSDGGVLILDVNNMFNGKQYGTENAARNRARFEQNPHDTTIGDFTASRMLDGKDVRTTTHIFAPEEVTRLVSQAGFDVEDIVYIDYETGEITDESHGQVMLIARKRR